MSNLLDDDAAMRLIGLPLDSADEVAAMARHAVVDPKPGRRWDREKLLRWARVLGCVSAGFAPHRSGSGARG